MLSCWHRATSRVGLGIRNCAILDVLCSQPFQLCQGSGRATSGRRSLRFGWRSRDWAFLASHPNTRDGTSQFHLSCKSRVRLLPLWVLSGRQTHLLLPNPKSSSPHVPPGWGRVAAACPGRLSPLFHSHGRRVWPR